MVVDEAFQTAQRLHQQDPHDPSCRAQFAALLHRLDKSREAERVLSGHWIEDQREDQWHRTISQWQCTQRLSGRHSIDPGTIPKAACHGDLFVFQNHKTCHVADVASGKTLFTFTFSRNFGSFLTFDSGILFRDGSHYSFWQRETDKAIPVIELEGLYPVNADPQGWIFRSFEGKLILWPENNTLLQANHRAAIHAVDRGRRLALVTKQSNKLPEFIDLDDHGLTTEASSQTSSNSSLIVNAKTMTCLTNRNPPIYCDYRNNETQRTSLDNLAKLDITGSSLSSNSRNLRVFDSGVPRSYEIAAQQFSDKEKWGGVGISGRPARIGSGFWHPNVDVVAFNRGGPNPPLELRSTRGETTLNCGRVRFLGFGAEGRTMLVARPASDQFRIELWTIK